MIPFPSMHGMDNNPGLGPFGILSAFVAAMGIAAVVFGFIWYGTGEGSTQAAERAAYRTFMQDCVPTQPASRCKELWYWRR